MACRIFKLKILFYRTMELHQKKTQLKEYLNRYTAITDKEIDIIFDHGTVAVYGKKTFLLEEGKPCPHRYFILEGLVRQFRVDASGNELIHGFAIENWWVTNMDSFVNEIPSVNAIQALEKTTVLQLTKKDMESLFSKIPLLERAFRLISENMLIALQRRDEVYMKMSSQERYFNLVNNIPHFAQRVPQYMIASYLDITPEYLSEIKKNGIGRIS